MAGSFEGAWWESLCPLHADSSGDPLFEVSMVLAFVVEEGSGDDPFGAGGREKDRSSAVLHGKGSVPAKGVDGSVAQEEEVQVMKPGDNMFDIDLLGQPWLSEQVDRRRRHGSLVEDEAGQLIPKKPFTEGVREHIDIDIDIRNTLLSVGILYPRLKEILLF